MPNYVHHRIVITGPARLVSDIRDRHFAPLKNGKGEDHDYQWDFDSIIPMPQELKDIQADGIGAVDEFLTECLTGKPYPTNTFERGRFGKKTQMHQISEFLRWCPNLATARTPEDVIQIMDQEPPKTRSFGSSEKVKDIDIARMRARAIDACGYGDTLHFCTEEWGTKWGSFRCAVVDERAGRMEFIFETAWSPPAPIIRKFAEMYPTITMIGKAFDEGWNFEANILAIGGIAATEQIKATNDGYAYVYGRAYIPEE